MKIQQAVIDVAMIARNGIDRTLELEAAVAGLKTEVSRLLTLLNEIREYAPKAYLPRELCARIEAVLEGPSQQAGDGSSLAGTATRNRS